MRLPCHKAAPQVALISRLNPVITGWSNYYSAVVSKTTYSRQDHLMYLKLRHWAKRRHSNKSGGWVSNKYWQTIGGNNWAFATRQEGSNPMRLRSHAETSIVRHVKVKGEASPYDGNSFYWSSRMGKHPEATKRVATLLKEQEGKCTHCGLYFREEDVLEIDHITPSSRGGKDEYKNLQILHKHCHDAKTADDLAQAKEEENTVTGRMARVKELAQDFSQRIIKGMARAGEIALTMAGITVNPPAVRHQELDDNPF